MQVETRNVSPNLTVEVTKINDEFCQSAGVIFQIGWSITKLLSDTRINRQRKTFTDDVRADLQNQMYHLSILYMLEVVLPHFIVFSAASVLIMNQL